LPLHARRWRLELYGRLAASRVTEWAIGYHGPGFGTYKIKNERNGINLLSATIAIAYTMEHRENIQLPDPSYSLATNKENCRMIPLKTQPLFTLKGEVAKPLEIGALPYGKRRIIPISGGTFEGPKLHGKVLPTGGDWMLVRPDGVAQIDVRATLETDDGALIYMHYGGFRHGPPAVMDKIARGEEVDPSTYYFRITPVFETASPDYAWLNRIVTVGIGDKLPEGPVYYIYEVL